MTKLKLKDSVYILEEDNDYVIIFTATRKVKKFKVDNLVKQVIGLLTDEEKIESDLIKRLSGDFSSEQISLCLSSLEREGILRRYEDNPEIKYSKQLSFIDELTSSWKETLDLQNKIRNSVITVFGIGGIGTWIVNGLYQIGIGEIRISDPDKIEKSNLNRQLFFDSRDIGKYKVDVIKEKLPDAKIIPFKKFVSENENLEELVSRADFLVNCADQPSVAQTSKIINGYAEKYNIPYCIAGGYNLHLGMVGPIIVPGKTLTFENFLEYQKSHDALSKLKVVKDINQTGNLGPIAGAVANIQTMEIFKYLIGRGDLNLNKFAEIDFMNFGIEWKDFSSLHNH